MPRGVDTSQHPGRKVGSDAWRSHTSVTAPGLGQSTLRNFGIGPEYTHTVFKSDEGYHGEVEHYTPEGRGAYTLNTYVAGPYRTQQRAIGAAEGISGRISRGRDVSRYNRSSHFLSAADVRGDY